MIQNRLFEFWKQKEIEWGRTIRVTEVSKATGIGRDTLTRLRSGASYPDEKTIDKLCAFFGVAAGPVEFIRYEPD